MVVHNVMEGYVTQVFGHKKVSILDGGLPRWLANGFPVTDGATITTTTKPVTYQIKDRLDIVRSMKDVEKAIRDGDVQVHLYTCRSALIIKFI